MKRASHRFVSSHISPYWHYPHFTDTDRPSHYTDRMLADLTDILDRAFQQRIRQLMTEWHIPGVAVVLVPDEGEPVTYSFGERDHGLPVTPQVGPPIDGTELLILLTADPLFSQFHNQGRDRHGSWESLADRWDCLGI